MGIKVLLNLILYRLSFFKFYHLLLLAQSLRLEHVVKSED